jgi:DNA-binding NtrC family response regulator
VSATRLGAFDFMEKPLDRNRVVVTARNALERRKMWREVHDLRRAVEARWELLGNAPVMHDLRRQIAKVAPTRSRILITGQSGTGKELIARAIHRNSSVSNGAFVKVNCAAIPPELIESELFGHERGAFTGAIAKKRGLFEVADGGTIFLDEIGDMAPPLQAKLLRVLQERVVTPVGGRPVPVDVRILAATHQDLRSLVAAGKFREDLYWRLGVVPIHLPPLRDRRADVFPLAEHFLAVSGKRLAPQAAARLLGHAWPGNVRELRNAMERAATMSRHAVITADDLEFLGAEAAGEDFLAGDLPTAVARLEAAMIRRALAAAGGNRTEAARRLNIHRQLLYEKMKRYAVELSEFRTESVGKADEPEADAE